MKKFILSSLFLISTILANEFEKANEVTKRINPTLKDGAILSYYESIKDAKRAVVNISTQRHIKQNLKFNRDDPFEKFFAPFFDIMPRDRIQSSLGSGVIISKDGYILTNNHVISDSDKITVIISEDEYSAKVVGTDPKSDLAIIKIEAKNLTNIKFGNSDRVKEGDVVFAIGNPFGIGQTITQGIISALNKTGIGINDYENFIQTDASINPGNSGGALVDSRGVLIGVNTAIISSSGGNNGIGFAIPSNMVYKIAKSLIDKGLVERGYLGVSIGDLNSDLKDFYNQKNGALILSVEPNSSADRAGIKRGDLIVKIDNKKILNASELKNRIGSFTPNEEILINLIRDNREIEIKVSLGVLKSNNILDEFEILDGLGLNNLTTKLKKEYNIDRDIDGVLVTSVKINSKGFEYGFLEGDVIIQVEKDLIDNIDDLKQSLSKSGKKRIFINRAGAMFVLVIK